MRWRNLKIRQENYILSSRLSLIQAKVSGCVYDDGSDTYLSGTRIK